MEKTLYKSLVFEKGQKPIRCVYTHSESKITTLEQCSLVAAIEPLYLTFKWYLLFC